MRKLLGIVLWLLLGSSGGFGQAQTFWPDQFVALLEAYHPLALQANLLQQKGESVLRSARGGFDPYLYGSLDQKNFDGKNYFSLLSAGLKVPTWYGVELKGGYDQNGGVYLNPEDNVPSNGLWYAGISVPVGQGLVIDKRRTALRQAEIYLASTGAERRLLLNDLFQEAILRYWTWVEAWNQLQVFDNAVELAQFRFEGVRTSFLQGDKPAIDTLEAFILVQNRQLEYNQWELEYRNQTLELNNFLWFENLTPLEIGDSLVPPLFEAVEFPGVWTLDSLQSALDQLPETHPEMLLYGYKLDGLEWDRRLKAEALKPKLNVNYNFLAEPAGGDSGTNLSPNNYKWGLELAFPVLLRKERGDLQMARLKIQETEYQMDFKLQTLQNKIRQYYNGQLTMLGQIDLYGDAVRNYEGLFRGEQQKFRAGESSLFLVNSRETKLLDSRLKLNEIRGKYWKARTGFYWGLGEIYREK